MSTSQPWSVTRYRMLKLRTKRAIGRQRRPAIVHHLDCDSRQYLIDRLDGKYPTSSHALTDLISLPIMRYLRCHMKLAADTVAYEIAHHRAIHRIGVGVDRFSDIADAGAVFNNFEGLFEADPSCFSDAYRMLPKVFRRKTSHLVSPWKRF